MSFILSIIIIDNINALSTQTEIKTELETQSQKFKHRNKKQALRQNFNDISRFSNHMSISNHMSAQPQQGYIPREVNSISANKKQQGMQSAHILGNQRRQIGGNEKPAIWEKIKIHRTSVSAGQSNFGNGNQGAMNVGGEAMKLLKRQNNLQKYGQGRQAVPVKMQMSNRYKNDPHFSNYENPTFLHMKSEKKPKGPKTINVPKMPMITPFLQAASAKDVKLIQKKLKNTKTKKQKLKALKFSKNVLKKDAKKICDKIKKEISKVLGAKKTALNLSNTLNKYIFQIKKENASKLKLTDQNKVKKQLKNKIFREVEGFRNTGKEFNLLRKVSKIKLKSN